MSDVISAETSVEVDYSALVQAILEQAGDDIDSRVSEAVNEHIGDAIDDYMRYSYDISSDVQEAVSDAVGDEISGLLDGVNPGSLCRLGTEFQSAIHCILKHHIEDWVNIFDGREITNGNGASTEDIQKMVAEKFNKEMKVEVTFVDKEPAAVVSGELL